MKVSRYSCKLDVAHRLFKSVSSIKIPHEETLSESLEISSDKYRNQYNKEFEPFHFIVENTRDSTIIVSWNIIESIEIAKSNSKNISSVAIIHIFGGDNSEFALEINRLSKFRFLDQFDSNFNREDYSHLHPVQVTIETKVANIKKNICFVCKAPTENEFSFPLEVPSKERVCILCMKSILHHMRKDVKKIINDAMKPCNINSILMTRLRDEVKVSKINPYSSIKVKTEFYKWAELLK